MMRVVMVGPFGFHPNKTMRSRALPLARGLVARGHEVLVVMPPWQTPAEGGRRWVEDGVSVSYVTLGGGIVGITRRLVGGVRAWEPDIVHCFKPKAYSGLVSWWLWQRGWRQGLVMDTDDWEGWGGWNERADYSWSQKHFFAWQERWGLTHCSGVTVASRHLETLVWGLGVAREKVAYVPNGSGLRWPVAEASGLRAELGWEKRPILLLYSRLFEFDVSRLTRILERVREQVPDLAILSIGTGLFAEEAAQLREEWQVAGLLESVHDLGWVEEQLLPGVLAVADVGIYLMDDTLLNRTKCPVKLADMVAGGVPVVAEGVGQVREYVVEGVNGVVCESGDVTGLVAGLVRLLTDEGERRRLGAMGGRRYEALFAWGQQVSVLERVYERLLGEKGD